MSSSEMGTDPSEDMKKAPFPGFLQKLRKRRIIETLAAFIGGGWLLVEVVERLLVGHYHFPEETIDLTVVSVIGALLATLVWRWFCSRDKQPGNIKFEVLLVPLILLAAVAIDLVIVLKIIGIPGKTLLVAGVSVCLGIAWVIIKSLQWAATAAPPSFGQARTSKDPPSPVSAAPDKSIVVLPFTDLSPQKDQEYFCDGMSEEIITDLSHVHELLIISRSSAMTFKGTQKTIPEIARTVNVRYVLEGSVRKAGNGLRITAQLIDAVNDGHIWAEKYSGTLDHVFDIQEKVSRAIVGALKMKLAPDEDRRIAERPLTNVPAYECYLRANVEICRFTEDALDRAIRLLQNGLDIIGDNALLYSTMAGAYWQYVNIGVKQEDYISRSEEYVKKALALDPDSPQALWVLATICRDFRGNLKEAIRNYKRALAVNPNESMALMLLGHTYVADIGKPLAGLPFLEKFRNIDPLNSLHYGILGVKYFFDRQYALALEQFHKWSVIEPENPVAQCFYAIILAHQDEIDKAISIIEKLSKAAPDNGFTKLGLLLKYAFLKDKVKAFQVMTTEYQRTCKRDPEWSYYVAVKLSLLEAKQEALDWLENAIDRGFINYPALEREPFLDSIRGEERFKNLMERVKYDWEHFEE